MGRRRNNAKPGSNIIIAQDLDAIKPVDSIVCGHPYKPMTILQYGGDYTLGKAVIRSDVPELKVIVLRCSLIAKKAKQQKNVE